MSKQFPLLSAALGIEGITVTDNVPSVSITDLTTIEAALADRDRQITELQAQVATLKQTPADTTTNVVETNSNSKEETPLDAYYRRVNEAKALYKSLP